MRVWCTAASCSAAASKYATAVRDAARSAWLPRRRGLAMGEAAKPDLTFALPSA